MPGSYVWLMSRRVRFRLFALLKVSGIPDHGSVYSLVLVSHLLKLSAAR